MLSVIIPANNEAAYIARCLTALFASTPVDAEAIVVANGCTDDTVAVAGRFAGRAAAAGWALTVVELAEGSKRLALDAGDAAAQGAARAYLDADVEVSPELLSQIAAVLERDAPVYASGRPLVAPATSWITRQYARFWQRLPFVNITAPGYGLFAVNAAGRARWDTFPAIISDDTYVRLQFTPDERVECPATYTWPMIEGFGPLVRVRRRQNAGLDEIERFHPELLANEGKPPVTPKLLAGLALRDPIGFATYVVVALAVKRKRDYAWVRGR